MIDALDISRTIYDSLQEFVVVTTTIWNWINWPTTEPRVTLKSLLDGYLLFSLKISPKLSDFVAEGF